MRNRPLRAVASRASRTGRGSRVGSPRLVLLVALVATSVLAYDAGGATPAGAQTPESTPPAGTRCAVAPDTVIPCDDPGITDAHAPNCPVRHYHGVLAGVADPEPRGCGHGEVVSLAPEEEPWFWERINWSAFFDWFDVGVQGATTGQSPKSIYDSVTIVEDAAPSIAESVETAEEYFEVYPDAPDRARYTLSREDPEGEGKSWLYRWFWGLFE
ncbi:MAG: hypothetical protein M0R73_11115 [Dehalococcoidia bacterium]|nr:hypothetical protein [Dehalococcoidia bacterium]